MGILTRTRINGYPEIKPPTPQEMVKVLTAFTIIAPDKFEFMDKSCNEIWADGLFYVRDQETYDRCIEEYKRECGLED